MINKIKKWIFLQKEGIIVGSLIGALLWYLGWNIPLINLQVTGIPKLAIMMGIFSLVGAAVDAIWEPSK